MVITILYQWFISPLHYFIAIRPLESWLCMMGIIASKAKQKHNTVAEQMYHWCLKQLCFFFLPVSLSLLFFFFNTSESFYFCYILSLKHFGVDSYFWSALLGWVCWYVFQIHHPIVVFFLLLKCVLNELERTLVHVGCK